MSSARSFQQQMPGLHCFGCGPDNRQGLQIASYWADDHEARCTFTPELHHCAGPPHVLNGGIIATLIDCHSVCTATMEAYRREGRAPGTDPAIILATGSLAVEYRRPAPIDRPVELRARVKEASGRRVVVSCTLCSAGVLCAEAEVVAVRVPPSWARC